MTTDHQDEHFIEPVFKNPDLPVMLFFNDTRKDFVDISFLSPDP
jgi:hypothetical protein